MSRAASSASLLTVDVNPAPRWTLLYHGRNSLDGVGDRLQRRCTGGVVEVDEPASCPPVTIGISRSRPDDVEQRRLGDDGGRGGVLATDIARCLGWAAGRPARSDGGDAAGGSERGDLQVQAEPFGARPERGDQLVDA